VNDYDLLANGYLNDWAIARVFLAGVGLFRAHPCAALQLAAVAIVAFLCSRRAQFLVALSLHCCPATISSVIADHNDPTRVFDLSMVME
jgi:hypothetical protein